MEQLFLHLHQIDNREKGNRKEDTEKYKTKKNTTTEKYIIDVQYMCKKMLEENSKIHLACSVKIGLQGPNSGIRCFWSTSPVYTRLMKKKSWSGELHDDRDIQRQTAPSRFPPLDKLSHHSFPPLDKLSHHSFLPLDKLSHLSLPPLHGQIGETTSNILLTVAHYSSPSL